METTPNVESVTPIIALETELMGVRLQIKPLMQRASELERQIRDAKSRRFIKVNQIRKEDVETPDGPDKPWFGTIYPFVAWVKENSTKNWASWNGTIYRTSDLINGRMPEDAPAYTEHLS